jgi:pimeloyl-ACP methyl ester carboxylesterase
MMTSTPSASHGRFIDLPGVKLWAVDIGEGIPIVLLHAATGTGESWAPQIAPLAACGYRVIAFDRRGWGRSLAEPSTGPQPGTATEDLDALVDALALPAFHLIGIAAGGFVALDYAAWRPERLRSLVVAASNGRMSEPEISAFVERIEIPGLHDLPAAFREVSPSYRGADPHGAARWSEIEARSRQPGAPRQPLRAPNTFAKLRTITTPALVISAGADLIAPPALMRIWSAALPHHEWTQIDAAGHAVAWEQPEVFNRLVQDFIGRH